MKYIFVCYPQCSTCRKAKKHLTNKGIEFEERNIKTEKPTKAELAQWHGKTDYPIKRFFNTSGKIYRELNLKDKLPEMTEEEIYELLSTDGMLVKRPILVGGDKVLVGYKEAEWEEV